VRKLVATLASDDRVTEIRLLLLEEKSTLASLHSDAGTPAILCNELNAGLSPRL
jgi:hypothetical protein